MIKSPIERCHSILTISRFSCASHGWRWNYEKIKRFAQEHLTPRLRNTWITPSLLIDPMEWNTHNKETYQKFKTLIFYAKTPLEEFFFSRFEVLMNCLLTTSILMITRRVKCDSKSINLFDENKSPVRRRFYLLFNHIWISMEHLQIPATSVSGRKRLF